MAAVFAISYYPNWKAVLAKYPRMSVNGMG
jgi:hypothetical protein